MSVVIVCFVFVILILFISYFFAKNAAKGKVDRINRLIDEDNIEEAEALLKTPIITSGSKYILKWLHARLNMKNHAYSLALNAADDLLNDRNSVKYIDEKDLHKMLAKIYKETHHLDSAKIEYKKIIFIDKDDLEANFYLGKIYFEEKKYHKAEFYLNNSLNYSDESYETLYMLAFIYEKSDKIEEARKYIFASTKSNPEYEPAIFLKGKILYRHEEYKEAQAVFEKFETNSEYFVEAQTYLALSLYEIKEKANFKSIAQNLINAITDVNMYNDIVDKLIISYLDNDEIDAALNIMYNLKEDVALSPAILKKIRSYKFINQYQKLKELMFLDDHDFAQKIVEDILEENGCILDKIENIKTEMYFYVIRENSKYLIVINRVSTEVTVEIIKNIVNTAKQSGEYQVTILSPFMFTSSALNVVSERPVLTFYNGREMGQILNGEKQLFEE